MIESLRATGGTSGRRGASDRSSAAGSSESLSGTGMCETPTGLSGVLSRSSIPLGAYPSIWGMLEAEPDVHVRACATIALSGDAESERALSRWVNSFDASMACHLLTIGTDRVNAEQALRLLRRHKDRPDARLRKIVARALEIIEGYRECLAGAVDGLSTLERHLLRGRTDEESFQTGCLAELLGWSRAHIGGCMDGRAGRGARPLGSVAVVAHPGERRRRSRRPPPPW